MIAREGAKVVVRSERGVQYSRNAQDVKKIPVHLTSGSEHPTQQETEEDDQMLLQTSSGTELGNDPEGAGTEVSASSPINESARPHRIIRKPNRFKDMILFSIFE